MSNKDEIAALKARIEQLERASKPPAPPPDLKDWQPINPIDRVSMPVSALREMAQAAPTDMIRDIAMRDARAPQGPSSAGAIPSSQQVSSVRGTGWSREIPISNPPGVNWVDKLMDAQDQKDRAELVEREAKFKAMQKLAESKP